MPSYEVTMDGNWTQVRQMMVSLPRFVQVLREKLASQIAQKYYDALTNHIRSQDLPLTPLNEWYKEWKAKKGLDTRILIATGELLDSIKIYDLGAGEKFVGVKGGKQHRGGIDMALLALVHEYGSVTRGVPARPAYRLTLVELKSELQTVINEIIKEARIEVFGR
jgi:hypothetical protein